MAPPEAAGPLRRERLRTARLYFVCDARPHGEDPGAAAAGGAGRRRRHRPAAREAARRAEIERTAATFRRLCDTYSALFIVNDDPDLARACEADGVHVGQDDAPVERGAGLLGPEAIIGHSTHSEEQIAASAGRRSTTSASGRSGRRRPKGRPGVGLELVSHAAEQAAASLLRDRRDRPGNAAEVVEAGAQRLCVVRAIRDAADPAAAAESLRGAFGEAGEVAPGG